MAPTTRRPWVGAARTGPPTHAGRSGFPGTAEHVGTVVLLTALLAPAACSDSVAPDDGPTTSRERIVFVRGDDMAADIYSMNLDGTGAVNLTDHPAAYRSLDLSPDGRRLTFYSDRGGCYDIFTMDVDGTDLRQLTGVDANDRCNSHPRWSPDGTKIAFFTSRDARDGKGWDAYVMNADGSGQTDVGNNPSTDPETADDLTDGWSADGRVVVLSTRDGTVRTYLAEPDGSGVEPFMDGWVTPRWSPDGSRIAYTVDDPGDDPEVHVMNADGSASVNVSSDPAPDALSSGPHSPWSPDGTTLVFSSTRSGNPDFWAVAPDGTGLANLSDDPARDDFLSWCPDGTKILFQSKRFGRYDLFVANADGSGVVRLTDDPLDDRWAVWVR